MRALIVGGNGFIGSTLALRLDADGHAVRVLDHGSARQDVDWSRIEYVRGDIHDPAQLDAAMAGVDVVFHLASTTVPGTSNLDPQADVRSNLIGALDIIHAMRRCGIRRLVFLSSGGTVYGDPERSPVSEGAPLRPISSYGVVKVAIENYMAMYGALGDLEPLVIRPANPYGPRQSTSGQQGAIAIFLGRVMRGETIEIWGDGGIIRDYIFIDDLVDLIASAAVSGLTGTFNAGSGMGYSLREVCAVIEDVVGARLKIAYREQRRFDVRNVVLDIAAAEAAFGWEPRTSLADGIARTWRYLNTTGKEGSANE